MRLFGFGKKKEQERQKEAERQRELEKQKELEEQRALERQRELERQKEIEKQKEAEALEAAKNKASHDAALLQEIKKLVSACNGIALVNYRGLTVQQDTDLRALMRNINVTYKIYKNTALRNAIKNTDFANLLEHTEGALSTAFFQDPQQLGILLLFCQKTGNTCSVAAASYQNKLLLPKELEALLGDLIQQASEGMSSLYAPYFRNLTGRAEAENDTESLILYLTDPGEPMINCIKLIHDIAALGLKESKELAEKARESKTLIRTFDDEESLRKARKQFDEIGAKTEIGS